jgi:O-acetyl-ADP-ribose deacetylase (regulator of RNase III)
VINVGGASIEVIQGDITLQTVDAIVNAANNHLWMGSGVAGAIKRTGGHQIEQEAVSQGPIDVGDAVITSAGTLHASHVLHAAGMGQDLKTDTAKIAAATRSCRVRLQANTA